MSEPITNAADAVRVLGAVPAPMGPGPQSRSILDRARDALGARMTKDDLRLVLENVINYAAGLEAEREQLRQLPSLPLDKLAKALLLMETGPALAWAHAMSDHDLHGFLDDLVSAAMGRWQSDPEVPDRTVLANVEKVCATWRTPGQGNRLDGPEPQTSELEYLRKERDAFRDQRNAVFATNERLLAEVQESDQARLRAENETRTVKRGTERLAKLLVARTEDLLTAEARVAGLEAERRTTNEALDDAVKALRERQAEREVLVERMRAGQTWQRGRNPELVSEDRVSQSELRKIFGIPLMPPWEGEDALTQTFAPVASLREVPDGEHAAWVRHSYRTPHDLPETGGDQC